MKDDPFALLGVPRQFDLDEKAVHRQFITLSAAAHPDRHTDPLDQADAADRAAAINGAYRILKDPELRANALLGLLGGADKSDDKRLPPDLLVEMMDLRERQEEAEADEDTEAIAVLRTIAETQRRERLVTIGQLLKQAAESDGPARNEAMANARLELNALRYFARMIEQLP